MKEKELSNYAIIDNIRKKLNSYGFDIVSEYKVTEGDEYIVMTPSMTIFIKYKENTIGLSHPVTILPDIAASNTLILKEIEGIEQIYIMESFINTADKKILFGEDALKYLYKIIIKEEIEKISRDEIYTDLLKTIDWKNCSTC